MSQSISEQTMKRMVLDERAESLLEIYLHDHLSGAIGGLSLVKRCHENNRGTTYAEPLGRLVSDLEEDLNALRTVISALALPERAPAKEGMAWLAEKVGRLKANGSLTSYSPLSRVLELEGLRGGIVAKAMLWKVVASVRERDERLRHFDADNLHRRAEEQEQRVAQLHERAVEECFGTSRPGYHQGQ